MMYVYILTQVCKEVFKGAEKVVLCNTATKFSTLSYRIANAFRTLIGTQRPPTRNETYYLPGRGPEEADFLFNKHVVDVALAHHVDHAVFVATMGGYRSASLSAKEQGSEMTPGLRCRRALERYLMRRLKFTILHAGTIDREVPPAGVRREVVWDTDDALLRSGLSRISRAEVAETVLQALQHNQAMQRSIDIAAGPPLSTATATSTAATGTTTGTGTATGAGAAGVARGQDWVHFWARPGDCLYPAAP